MSPSTPISNITRSYCRHLATLLLAFVVIISPHPAAYATNGTNQIGFGTESVGMGGADIAVARDTTAMNTNPAGLRQIEDRRSDLLFAVVDLGGVRHKDQFGNDTGVSNENLYFGNLGYAYRSSKWPITVGVALFAQGGFGVEFDNLTTAFGSRDNVGSQFRIARITPGIAWQVNEKVSLGASLIGTYADLDQRLFPNTSFANPMDPANSFFGFRMKDMDTYSAGIKLGSMFKPNKRLTLGAVYSSEIDLELDGGTFTADMSAIGLGKVTYKDVKVQSVDQPREFGVGAALQWNDKLLLAMELNWIDWSGAAKSSTLRASDPSNPAAPPSIEQTSEMNWRDQYVVAIGAAYDLDNKTVIRGGYNYGRNPVPDENLNILLAPTGEHHLTLGLGRKLDKEWRIDAAVEWLFENETTYTNPALPFGNDTKGVAELFVIHVMLSWVI